MSAFRSPPSVGTMSDLDGFSVTGDSYYPHIPQDFHHMQSDDFGFDPPSRSGHLIKTEQTYSPPDDTSSFSFDFDPIQKDPASMHGTQMDRMISQTIPNSAASVSRYGQVTPPRSNSESSVEKSVEEKQTASERRKRTSKIAIKEESAMQPQPPVTGRKRRNTRKSSIATNASANPEDDDKRKQSLEKNRLAAAKCRVNKKEKTEQLQRDSHDKAVENAFLKEQVMRLKEEVQQINALLLSHANCEGCKSPEDIQRHLNDLGQEFFNSHLNNLSHDFSGFGNLAMDMNMDHDNYFSPASDHSLINPPLPEFDREPEFDVSTPMHDD